MARTADTSTFKNWLKDQCGECVSFDEPMSRHTSFKVGGPAEIFARPHTMDMACRIVLKARETGVPVFMAGDGTNLVVADRGIRGLVLVLHGIPSDVSFEEQTGGTVLVTAHAGVRTRTLCRLAIERGFRGMNFALGIPGTMGGNIAMNAGTHLGAMDQVVHSIRVLLDNGDTETLDRQDLRFSYRKLDYPARFGADSSPVIVGASLLLEKGDREQIHREAQEILQRRTASQPVSLPNAGCIFKNPEGGEPAGKLIDMAGLKGRVKGGAMISDRHANFIVNTGNARAEDILSLIELAQKEVFDRFRVELETEVKRVGL